MMLHLLLARLRNTWIRARLRGKELYPPAALNLTALDGLDLSSDARGQRYVVLDLETTGLSLSRDRVLSMAAFRVVSGRIPLGEIFSSLVNPGRSIPLSAIKIHGILPDMVAQAPSFAEALDDFLQYLGKDILAGFHVRFDLNFINKVMRRRHGFKLQNLILDIAPMCRKMVLPSHLRSYSTRYRRDLSLDAVANHFRIDIPERHTALGDALAAAMILQRLIAELEKRGQGRLRDLIARSSVL
jgi:DNA polymerase III subunit epsilon